MKQVKSFLCLVLLALVAVGTLDAQTARRVSGIVKDDLGEPMIGVQVIPVGATANGTVTDIDGKYSVSVPKDVKQLQFTFIGMATQTVSIDGRSKIDIVLKEEAQALGEVVVTALGIKRQEKALSYNVQQVKGEALTAVKDANFVNSLNGKVAGVTINKSAAGVGGASRVVMRGAKSIEGDNNALYVIDGIPLFNTKTGNDSGAMGEGRASSEGIADINPEDIESISVLAGPSAAALYGSSAANGVILINTKKGEEGKTRLSVSSHTEFTRPFITPRFQNTYGNRMGEFQSWGPKLATPSSYDPVKDFFLTGTNFTNSVTLTTGTKHNQTYASIASTDARGIVPNNTYARYNFTVRNTSKMFNDKIQLDLGASYVKQKDNNMVSQGFYWNPVVEAYLFPRGENFEDVKTFERYDPARRFPVQYWPLKDDTYAKQNPYWTAYRNLSTNDKNRYMFNAGLTYYIVDGINLSGRFRMDRSTISYERKIFASSHEHYARSKGDYAYSEYKDTQYYADVMANINKGWGDWSISANVGASFSDYFAEERGYQGSLKLVPNLFSIQNLDLISAKPTEKGGDSPVRNFALFASAELGWRGMLYLTLTGRNDWNSRLVNSSEPSFFYPSIGLSALLNQMIKMPRQISMLKLRGSYTQVGSPVSKLGMTPGTITTPIVGGVLRPSEIYPFGDFKAERTKSYEIGLTARFFNRLNLDVTYYHSNTFNQTFVGELPEGAGYRYAYLQAGNVENKGLEASLSYGDKLGDFGFNAGLTFTTNKNVIKEMVRNYKHPLKAEPFDIDEVKKDGGRTILRVGGSINDIYANKFFRKDHQGFIFNEPTMEEGAPVFLGKTTPDFTLGFGGSMSYKGLGLSFVLNGRFGGVVTSTTEAMLDFFGVSERSALARDNGGVSVPQQGNYVKYDAQKYYQLIGTKDYNTQGYYTYSATNIRLQELTLSYTMPKEWFKGYIQGLTLSLTANNLLMLYNKAPHDPELTPSTATFGQGNDAFMQPSVRSLGFGIKLNL